MKLRNRLTGEIVYWEHGPQYRLGKEYESIKEFAEEWEDATEQMDYDINDLTEHIYDWFDEKGLHDPVMQFAKLNEEVGEMAYELTRGRKDSEEMKDAIGDVFVTLVGMAHHLDMDLSECINMAYKEIRGRTGKVVDGSFIKDGNTD